MPSLVYTIATGQAVSIGSIVADPLPAGLAAFTLTTAEYDELRAGTKAWDAATLQLVVVPPDPLIVLIAEDDAEIADIIANALATLDSFAVFVGTASNAQLTGAVKELSRIVSRLVRALDRRGTFGS